MHGTSPKIYFRSALLNVSVLFQILGSVTAMPPQKKRVGRRPRGDHLCKICNKVFLTELNLRQHKSEHKPVDQDQMYASIQKDISSGEATLVIRT